MKVCSKCQQNKNLSEYHLKSDKITPRSRCKDCTREENRARYEKYKASYYPKMQEYVERNKEKVKKYRSEYSKNNPEKRRVIGRRYYNRNRDSVIERKLKWVKDNPEKDANRSAKRRAKKLQATPSWAELDKIAVLYEKAKWLESLTGLKYHVDHIIPLKGETVCGLHCWNNLQILESSLNITKSNKH